MNGFEIPLMGMATVVIIPVAVFVWLYFEEKIEKGCHARNRQTY